MGSVVCVLRLMFVAAGDHLVHHCPTWQWDKGEESKVKPYLPPDKQFLITRNVPCYKRVKQMDNHQEDPGKVIEEENENGGWVDTHHFAGNFFVTCRKCKKLTRRKGKNSKTFS